jgi:MFS family permease
LNISLDYADCIRTWRWCFYINLPFGAFTLLGTFFFLNIDSPKKESLTVFDQIKRLDPIGIFFFVPSMVCLILALQWGGTTLPWSAPRIIGLLVGFAVLFILFIVVEVLTPTTAMAPTRVILNRSIAGSMLYMFLLSGGMMSVIYYLTIWFQAIKGDSAIHAGISTIPLVLSLVFLSIPAAIFVQKVGYYVPAMLLSTVTCAIGAGLLSTLSPSSNHRYWIGYQVLYGVGIGCGFQQSNLAAQTVLKRVDVPLGMALMFFMQQLGGAVFLSVSQNLFTNNLVNRLSGIAGLDAQTIVNTGATDLRNIVPAAELNTVLDAYSYSITRTFILAASLSACMILGAGVVEWKSIKGKPGRDKTTETAEVDLEQNESNEKS